MHLHAIARPFINPSIPPTRREDTMSHPQADSLMTDAVTELVAIGAAMACNCEPCFKHHFDKGRKLGVSPGDMRKAVNTALSVKAAPHRKIVETAERYLSAKTPPEDGTCGCHGPSQGCG